MPPRRDNVLNRYKIRKNTKQERSLILADLIEEVGYRVDADMIIADNDDALIEYLEKYYGKGK